jgi:hypothetical protein
MYEITKILLVIFLIFQFNLTIIFNDKGYLKRNKSSIHQSEILNNRKKYLRKALMFLKISKVFPV